MYVQNFQNLWIDGNDYYRDSRNWFICYTDGSCKGIGLNFKYLKFSPCSLQIVGIYTF